MRVLAIEPFYGGSHRAFLDGWIANSRHAWTLLTYSAHHWKWRMRHSACTAATEVNRRVRAGESWDIVFCSDMLNLAEFLGLCQAPVDRLPSVVYFHENQLTYPVRLRREWDFHFVMANFLSALAASQVWFNSQFHRDEFLAALPEFWSRLPDHRPAAETRTLAAKCRVEHPGVDLPTPRKPPAGNGNDKEPRIAWAARWEFDKNPESFFTALETAHLAHRSWSLSVLGQSYPESPDCFAAAQVRWSDRIRDWGFQPDRAAYIEALRASDVFVSTAIHEFFGLSVVEAIGAGALPVLPRRLSYPELLPLDQDPELACCFYENDEDLGSALARALDTPERIRIQQIARTHIQRFDWSVRRETLDDALERAASGQQM